MYAKPFIGGSLRDIDIESALRESTATLQIALAHMSPANVTEMKAVELQITENLKLLGE